jgi:hypothetical protein
MASDLEKCKERKQDERRPVLLPGSVRIAIETGGKSNGKTAMVDSLKYRRLEDSNWVEVRVHLTADAESGDLPWPTGDSSEAGGQ